MSQCSVCGGALVAGRCPSCDARRWSRFVHRELVLLLALSGVTVGAFFATRAVARGNETLHRRQAAAWYDQARRALQAGDSQAAVVGLRRAVTRDRENGSYRLALADALATTGLDQEARRVLLALRDAQPEDPDANLQLARLEARGSDADAARRYYQNAVAALWRPEQADERRRVRTELIEFLLAHDERARALSELLELAPNLPEDAASQAQAGRMFLAVGDPRRALDRFAGAIRLDSEHADALAGAGEAAFELGDYRRALRYLAAVPLADARATELRELAQLVITGDPLAPRLGANERRRRLLAAFQQAVQRLDTCLGDPALQAGPGLEPLRDEAGAFEAALRSAARRDPRDLVDAGFDLVYRIERAVDDRCTLPPTPLDRALLTIGRDHGFEQP